MDDILFTTLILITVLLIIGLPILTSWLLYKFLKQKEIHLAFKLITFTPVLLVSYFLYGALYPSDDFYKDDYKEVTSLEFPYNADIIYKTASFPDHFGDYTSSFLAELKLDDLRELEYKLIEKGFTTTEGTIFSKELRHIESRVDDLHYSKSYTKSLKNGKHYKVSFIKKDNHIIVTRMSW